MTDIRPWLEAGDAPAPLRDLLREAQASQPLDARIRARSRRRLLAMSALPAAAGVLFWIKNIALGAVLGSAVSVVIYAPSLRHSAVKPDVTARQPAARTTGVHRRFPVARDAGADDGGTLAATISSAAAPMRPSTAALPPAEPSQLVRETQFLEKARTLLGQDAQLALRSLDAHRREFPHGALKLERELMAVDALLKLGRRQEAQLRASQMREQAPGSIYEKRLSRLLGEGPAQEQ